MASYRVEVSRLIRSEIRLLPGHMRARVIRELKTLVNDPRPSRSRPLDLARLSIQLETGSELRRIRIESWRIIYFIEEDYDLITVLGIRKRPPYRYEDLDQLLKNL